MKIKTKVNPDFSGLEDFMKSLPSVFENKGETIKDDRNEIKIIHQDELKLCVKSFKRVTVFNRFMYSWFRGTKAKRSYKIALHLEEVGINTPKPVGYVEVYGKWNIMEKAFYVSLYQEHDFDISKVLDKGIARQESILSSFAEYMALIVHPAGAWHNDLSQSNVLINENKANDWTFSFIDLNRMEFKKRISPAKGLSNLNKLTNEPIPLVLMAEQYALATNKSPRFFSYLLLRSNLFFYYKRFYTKKALSIFKPRKKIDGNKE